MIALRAEGDRANIKRAIDVSEETTQQQTTHGKERLVDEAGARRGAKCRGCACQPLRRGSIRSEPTTTSWSWPVFSPTRTSHAHRSVDARTQPRGNHSIKSSTRSLGRQQLQALRRGVARTDQGFSVRNTGKHAHDWTGSRPEGSLQIEFGTQRFERSCSRGPRRTSRLKDPHSTSMHTAPSPTARFNIRVGRGQVSGARLLSSHRAPRPERARNRSACNHVAARKGRPTAIPNQASRGPHRTQTQARPLFSHHAITPQIRM
jgi:hypothetical protein